MSGQDENHSKQIAGEHVLNRGHYKAIKNEEFLYLHKANLLN